MKNNFVRHLIRMILAAFVVSVAFLSVAAAERVVIVTISEDQLASTVDTKGYNIKDVVEAYTKILEIKGDSVQVLGGKYEGKKEVYTVYETGTVPFNWTVGDSKRNAKYFVNSLEQLESIEHYDRIIVLTGFFNQSQDGRNRNKGIPSYGDIPAVVYGAVPLPKGQSLLDMYQAASGMRIGDQPEGSISGFQKYGNTLLKQTESFDAAETLEDLIKITFSGKINATNLDILVPESLASRSYLCIRGDNLKDARLILDGESVYRIVNSRSEMTTDAWYGTRYSLDSKGTVMVEIPEGIHGHLKISGISDAEMSLYYVMNQDYMDLLENADFCPEGMEYGKNGSVKMSLSDDPVIQEAKLLYPDFSYQAQITLLDTAETFTLYAVDQNTILWSEKLDGNAEVLLSVKEKVNGKDIIPTKKYRYVPITTLLNAAQESISFEPDMQPGKRDERTIVLKLAAANSTEDASRVLLWEETAEVNLQNQDGETVSTLTYSEERNAFISEPVKMPDHNGKYVWQITMTSGPEYLLKWEKSFATPTIEILNQTPVFHGELIELNNHITAKPGESKEFLIPDGLFTDPDSDPISVHYSVILNKKEIQENTVLCEDGKSQEILIPALNQFGEWHIIMSVEDNDGASVQAEEITVNMTNGNNAPQIDAQLLLQLEDVKDLIAQPDEGVEYKIPAGLFIDQEDEITLSYALYCNDKLIKKEEIESARGISPSFAIEAVNLFGEWKIELQAKDQYDAKSETLSLTTNVINGNTAPQVDSEKLAQLMENKKMIAAPDKTIEYRVPEGLITDLEDEFTIKYTLYCDGEEIKEETVESEGTSSPSFLVTAVNTFGEWEIKLQATDKHGLAGELISLIVNVTNGNTAPRLNREKLPPEEQVVPVMKLSDYQFSFGKGLFEDDEKDDMTIYVSMIAGSAEEEYTFRGREGVSEPWSHEFSAFDNWSIELYAVDEHQLASEKLVLNVVLVDALNELHGKLKMKPENPGKGERVRLHFQIEWPDEYQSLQIREWLESCAVTAKDNHGSTYPLLLQDKELEFVSEDIIMPTESAELEYTVSLHSNEGVEPQKEFNNIDSVIASIHNTAPQMKGKPVENQTQFLFNLEDYKLDIPSEMFVDAEEDPITIRLDMEAKDGKVVSSEKYPGNESYEVRMPGFGSWTVKLTAEDHEGKTSDTVSYASVTLYNLKLIVIIAATVLLLVIAVLIIVLRIRYVRSLPKYNSTDTLVFTLEGKEVSDRIKMPEGETEGYSLGTFAVNIRVLLTDSQWSEMKHWAIYPTKGDRPAFRREGRKENENTNEIDLGGGLKASVA